MPWQEIDVMENRRRFVLAATEEGACMASLCREYGISRKTGYKWRNRYLECGDLVSLEELPRRPKSMPGKIETKVEDRVVKLRKKYGWGSRKLRRLLRRKGTNLARSTIDRVLRDHELLGESRRLRPAVQRYEHAAPHDMLQMDFKGDLKLSGGRRAYPLSLLDDHSRYCLTTRAFLSQETEGVRSELIAAFEEHGVPRSILMDHGTPWWSSTSGHGLTRLAVFLIRQGVTMRWSGVGHPQTQGKIERYHRTMGEWLEHRGQSRGLRGLNSQLDEYRVEYNTVRPHEALDLETPESRYRRSAKPYDPDPPAWEYPEGSLVRRLSVHGCLPWRGHGYLFVSRALGHRNVLCEVFGKELLVTYRHMTIRHIDLETGRSHPTVRPYGPTGHEA